MCKKLIYLSSVVLFLVMSASVFGVTYPGKIGVNTRWPGRWELEFVDCVKTTRGWQQPGMGDPLTSSEVNADGWPLQDCDTVVFDMRPVAEWDGPDKVDDPCAHNQKQNNRT